MKRSWFILVAGLIAAPVAYFTFYFLSISNYQSLERSPEPELAWLKREFHLGDAEFARICQMHQAYLSGCMERCHRIDVKNEELKRLLAAADGMTPEIEKTLTEAAQLRAECQKKMLEHFLAVSRTMPPEQGKRYLAWVQEKTILSDSHKTMQH